MTTSISSTGSISSAGIGSGLDVSAIIAGLMKVEKLPLTDLEDKAESIQTSISAFGAVKSAMSSFRDAAAALALPSTWNATTGTSADPSAVAVSSSAKASAGNYAIEVQSLAASQSTVSGTFAASTDLVGAGTLHIDVGSWSTGQAAFTAKAGSTGVDITVAADDTLSTLADKINAAGAGVNAAVVNDASGARLVFSSTTTGTDNAFRITATDSDGGNTDAAGVSGFAFDPAGGTTATTLTQAAANASATINGLAISSATNNLDNVFEGLTLNLTKVTTGPVQVTVAKDAEAIKKSVLSTDLKYDKDSKVAGPLQADSAAVSLQRQLRNIIGAGASASTAFSTLSEAGLEIQTDGTLKLNDSKLSSAMANPDELKKLFTNVDIANPANNGFAVQLRTFGNAVLGGDGLLTARVAGLSAKLARNQDDQDVLSNRLAITEARLQAQYSALDTKMAGINTLSTYITQQIANWNKSTG
jgi:flagellar hook-associated protein 2